MAANAHALFVALLGEKGTEQERQCFKNLFRCECRLGVREGSTPHDGAELHASRVLCPVHDTFAVDAKEQVA